MNWKRALLVGIGWGIGTAIGIAAVFGIWHWHNIRPKPWDAKAITGEFEQVDTEGKEQTFRFFFTLENHTDNDYNLESNSSAALYARIQDSKSLMALKHEQGDVDFPIFIPQHGRTRIALHLPSYDYPWKNVNPSEDANRKQHSVEVLKYLNDEMTNLNGFEIFDHSNHYEIVLPPGWKQSPPKSP